MENPSFYDMKIDDMGNVYYYNEKGQLHRLDGPAIEYWNGGKEWYENGEQRRLDGLAVEYAKGDKIWFVEGKLHRLDGPAVEYARGDKEWWVNGRKVGRLEEGFTDEDFEQWKKEHGL